MANRSKRPGGGRTTPRGAAGPSLAQRRTRRRQILVLLVVGAMLLSTASAVLIAIFSEDTTEPDQPPQEPPGELWPEAEEALHGEVPCPGEEGSAERATHMPEGPPLCIQTTGEGEIDTEVDYMAVVSTNVGDLHYSLSTEHAPETVNNFVVLARYGFFDGAPFEAITPEGFAVVGGQFDDGSNSGPGYDLPSEAPPTGMIPTPGALAMLPTPDGESSGGTLVVALGNNAADLPLETTFFGLLLDGSDTVSALNRAASQTGAPTQPILIEGISVERAEPVE